MTDDPLSGHKATYDFLSDMFEQREAEDVEKADGLSPAAQQVYDLCMAGGDGGDEEACRGLAEFYDQQHPGGSDIPLTKAVSAGGMAGSLGEPAASVQLTDIPGRRKQR